MWRILLTVLLIWILIQNSEAQTTSTESSCEDADVILKCTLSGTFTFPGWRGPPSLIVYTIQGDASGNINPSAPAASRIQYAGNNKDLILSGANANDSGDYKCSYTGLGDHTVALNLSGKCPDTNTTMSTTTTTTSVSTTTTTTLTTTMAKPSTTTSTTIHATKTTEMQTSMTSAKSVTQSTPARITSDDGLSKELLALIVVVPVVLTIVGIVIIISYICYRKRKGKQLLPTFHAHKQQNNHRGNKSQASWHRQVPYLHHTEESNHRVNNRSKSPHTDDSYRLYSGNSYAGHVKHNPVYKFSTDWDPNRLYFSGQSARYVDYNPSYAGNNLAHTTHSFPSATTRYQYKTEYHGNKRSHESPQNLSYPGYSRQQKYINPSYIYM